MWRKGERGVSERKKMGLGFVFAQIGHGDFLQSAFQFYRFESLVSSLHNAHLAIPPFGEIFNFSLVIHFLDDVCCLSISRMIFLIYCCFELLVCLMDKNLV